MRPNRLSPKILKLGILAAIVFACSEPTAPRNGSAGAPAPIGYAVSDGMHAGNQHVFFLPPVVAAPSRTNGRFDPNVAVEVDICELTSAGCLTPFIAQFSRTTGSGSETIRLDGEQYIVNWHTERFPVSANRTYRIRLRVLGTILGFADVQVFANSSQAKNAVTGETFALVDGRTLPIKFRIEEGAVFVFPVSGGTSASPDGKVEMEIPAGALSEAKALTVNPTFDALGDELVLPGAVYDFGPSGTEFATPIKVTIKYDPSLVPAGTREEDIRLHTIETGVDGEPYWAEVKESSVDVINHEVSGLVPHFSDYGAKSRTPVSRVTFDPVTPVAIPAKSVRGVIFYLRDHKGNLLHDREAAISSANPADLAVSSARYLPPGSFPPGTAYCTGGCYTADVTAGDVPEAASIALTVRADKASGVFTPQVTPRAVSTVAITPLPDSPLAIRMYESRKLSVSLTGEDGGPITNRQLTWGGGGTAAKLTPTDAMGYELDVEALLRGTSTLTLAIQGSATTASVPLQVTSPPAARLAITPGSQTVPFGNATFAVKAYDARDVEIPDAPFGWTLAEPWMAQFDPRETPGATALINALYADGFTTTVSVTSESATASAELTVEPDKLERIAVNPETMVEHSQITVYAQLIGASGVSLMRPTDWFTENPEIAWVGSIRDGTASIYGQSPGSTTLHVISEGIEATTTVTVLPLPVERVEIGPASPRPEVGEVLRLSMIPYFGERQLIGRTATWSSDRPDIATVDEATGELRALHMGSVLISASVANADGPPTVGTMRVQVMAPLLSRIDLEQTGRSLVMGEATSLTFKAYDMNGQPVSGLDYEIRGYDHSSVSVSGTLDPTTGGVWSSTGEFSVIALQEGNIWLFVFVPGNEGVTFLFTAGSPVQYVSIVPSSPTVGVGGTVQLTATPYDDGGPLPFPITWSHELGTHATVTANGLVTGILDGKQDIIAESRGRKGRVTVTVASVKSVDVALVDPKIEVTERDQVQFVATLKSADGLVLTGRQIEWSTSDAAVATIDAHGLVTAVKGGSVEIYATSEKVRGYTKLDILAWETVATISVEPTAITLEEFGSVALTATAHGPSGKVLTGREFSWSMTSHPLIASVSQTSGNTAAATISGTFPGPATVRVVSENVSSEIAFTVTPAPTDRVEFSPANPTLEVGATQQMSVMVYSQNRELNRVPVWFSADPTIATIERAGLLKALRPGRTQLFVQFFANGFQGHATVNLEVVAAPIASVVIGPGSGTVFIGEQLRMTLEARATDNLLVPGVAYDVTSGDPACLGVIGRDPNTGIARIVATGTVAYPDVVGLRECTTTVTAFVAGTTTMATATMLVVSPVASIAFTPSNPTLALGGQVRLQTSMAGHFGGLVDYPVTWSSANADVATVDESGLVLGVANGEAVIVAESRGRRATTTVSVVQPLAVEVSTPTPVVMSNQTAQFSAILRFSSTTSIAAPVVWTSSNPNLATVNGNGLVTPRGIGTVTITATSSGVSGSAELEVTARWFMSSTEGPIGGQLRQGEYLQSRNGQYWLVMQADCNLVLYRGPPGDWSRSTALWGSGTQGRNVGGFGIPLGPCTTTVERDGNVVIYVGSVFNPASAVWALGVRGIGQYHIAVEDEGRWAEYFGAGPQSRGAEILSAP